MTEQQTAPPPGPDAWAPQEIARRVRDAGVVKVRRDGWTTLMLAVLAGAFIGLGALFSSVVVTGSELGFGPTRLLGGASFSLGLFLVVVAGAELFTGNNLVAMAWASGLIGLREVLRSWGIVYAGNALGALGTVGLAWAGGVDRMGAGAVGRTIVGIAVWKTGLGVAQMVALGVLCNALVCLAVWLTMAGRTVSDRAVAILFPVSAFVAMGLEHSIANLFFLPYGWLLDPSAVRPAAALINIAAVTAGNVLGGTVLVAAVYWAAYLRRA